MKKGKQNLSQWINALAGLLLVVLGIMGYASPEWFFTQKYDVLMLSSQSKTILRVMMGFYGNDRLSLGMGCFSAKRPSPGLTSNSFFDFRLYPFPYFRLIS